MLFDFLEIMFLLLKTAFIAVLLGFIFFGRLDITKEGDVLLWYGICEKSKYVYLFTIKI